MSKRITLSDRDRYIIGKVLAFMTSRADGLGQEGKCLVEMCSAELRALRDRVLND